MYYGDRPDQVLDAIKADFKSRGISLVEASARMKMKNRQSLTNLFYNLKKSNSYMTKKQAFRFAEAFGYYDNYLIHGWGKLYGSLSEDLEAYMSERIYVPENFASRHNNKQINFLMEAVSSLIDCTNQPDTIAAWKALLEENEEKYERACEQIAKRLQETNSPKSADSFMGEAYLHFVSLEKKKEETSH